MTYLSTCPIILIYGGRSLSSECRNKFNNTLIGNGRGFLLSKHQAHTINVSFFIAPQQTARWSMRMLKDAGNQSIFWSGFGAFWAMYSFQEWLAIFGLILGLISGLVNMYAKYQEGKVRENEERRAEELHKLKMEQLKRGLRDGTVED